MTAAIVAVVMSLALVGPASAQFSMAYQLPDQNEREGFPGGSVVEVSGGDLVAVYVENGEFTNFPDGTPANLYITRSSDGGVTWSTRTTLDTAIENGVQGIGPPKLFVLDNGDLHLSYWYRGTAGSTRRNVVSSDGGQTWASTPDASIPLVTPWGVTPSGTFVGIELDENTGSLYLATSADQGVNWTRGAFLRQDDLDSCSPTMHVVSDTNWIMYFSKCAFGYGGTTTTSRIETTDSGATWSSASEVMESGSGFGTDAHVVPRPDGAVHWLIYANGVKMSYRTSTDGGVTWSGPTDWLDGDDTTRDLSAKCSPGSAGPVCLFGRISGGTMHTNHFAQIDQGTVSIEYDGEIADGFRLRQNYPNPFAGQTTIGFMLPNPTTVTLSVYNALGEELAVLVDGPLPGGEHEATWDATADRLGGTRLPAGLYFYRLTTDRGTATGSMAVVR